MAFVTLCTSELMRAFAARSEYHSIFSIGVFSNRWMVAAVAVSFAARPGRGVPAVPAAVLRHRAAHRSDWLLMLPFFFASPIAMELLKFYFRSRKARSA